VVVKQMFIRELKESKMTAINWIPGEEISSNIYTKNLQGPLFQKHGAKFVGEDQYMKLHNE
jgi:hypothetical protein